LISVDSVVDRPVGKGMKSLWNYEKEPDKKAARKRRLFQRTGMETAWRKQIALSG
jgi:hypothetical protein